MTSSARAWPSRRKPVAALTFTVIAGTLMSLAGKRMLKAGMTWAPSSSGATPEKLRVASVVFARKSWPEKRSAMPFGGLSSRPTRSAGPRMTSDSMRTCSLKGWPGPATGGVISQLT